MLKLAILFSAVLILSGCAAPKPWVKPYQRGYLASELMSFDKDPISGRYMHHVYEGREAARGAEGSAGGGCGCN